ncbi:Flp family type IVb pilin [uncultured Agrobacterium sp.]|uniref:Flp family type IVb pilin n=1 Tax=uncultured Agrobacterium sp. TaxID=157277 RepID=UPI0025D759A6|nr:Flp family type IVb pilin [uncultured Agrobacterium sp.]
MLHGICLARIFDLHGQNIIWRYLQKFIAGNSGATAIEYGMIVGLIAGVIILAVGNIGNRLETILNVIRDALVGAAG